MIAIEQAINGSTPITGLFWAWFTPIVGTISMSGIPFLWKLSGDLRDLKRDIAGNHKVGEENSHAISVLEKSHAGVDAQLAKIQEAIVAIRESTNRRDEQFTAITMKLDQLPALATMLQVLTTSAASIVPRPEVDKTFHSLEARIANLERRS